MVGKRLLRRYNETMFDFFRSPLRRLLRTCCAIGLAIILLSAVNTLTACFHQMLLQGYLSQAFCLSYVLAALLGLAVGGQGLYRFLVETWFARERIEMSDEGLRIKRRTGSEKTEYLLTREELQRYVLSGTSDRTELHAPSRSIVLETLAEPVERRALQQILVTTYPELGRCQSLDEVTPPNWLVQGRKLQLQRTLPERICGFISFLLALGVTLASLFIAGHDPVAWPLLFGSAGLALTIAGYSLWEFAGQTSWELHPDGVTRHLGIGAFQNSYRLESGVIFCETCLDESGHAGLFLVGVRGPGCSWVLDSFLRRIDAETLLTLVEARTGWPVRRIEHY